MDEGISIEYRLILFVVVLLLISGIYEVLYHIARVM